MKDLRDEIYDAIYGEIDPNGGSATAAVNAIMPLVEAHVAEAKAEAWDEGYHQGVEDEAKDWIPADNPYRAAAIESGEA
jgi:hypothetical protein